jgi:hypothetical protein
LHDEGLVFCLIGKSIDNQHIFTLQRIFGGFTSNKATTHLHDEGLVFCLIGKSIDNQHIFTLQRIFGAFTSNKATSFSSSTTLFSN